MTTFLPGFVSEFPDNPVTDCVPASGLMLVNKITHNEYPSSIDEREELQNAMGTQNEGANSSQLVSGIYSRYKIVVPTNSSWNPISSALTKTNMGVVLFGSYQQLPIRLRDQGNQPGFDGIHAIYAQADGNGYCDVGDPLASRFYTNVSIAELEPFSQSYDYMSVLGVEAPARIVSYTAMIPGPTLKFYSVLRFVDTPYAPVTGYFENGSSAPVAHGIKGFWEVLAGQYSYKYIIYGKSGTFTIQATYSNGSKSYVDAWS